MLEGIGVPPAEERVYIALVDRSADDACELAGRVGLGLPEVRHPLTHGRPRPEVTCRDVR
ncbi:hypothetical protein [Streptomyces sp. NPDC056600]|uniref:hypothetical protein n=1 Tax=Streptomyces sp. NPDC056600 TaxID=3345874 RepID=UPI0036BE2E83